MSASSTTPNENDLELLSAYLDGELTDHDRAALEQRLAIEDNLRAELDSLRQTVNLVRGLPTLRVPRDFTLDPVVYGHPAARWRRLLTSPLMLQAAGVLGAAASVALIALALLSTNSAQKDSASMAGVANITDVPGVALLPTLTQIQPVISADTEETVEPSYAIAGTQEPTEEGRTDTETDQPSTVLPGEAQAFGQMDAHTDDGLLSEQATSAISTPLAESAISDQSAWAAPAAQQPTATLLQATILGQVQLIPPPGAEEEEGVSALAGSGFSSDVDQTGDEAAAGPAMNQAIAQPTEKEIPSDESPSETTSGTSSEATPEVLPTSVTAARIIATQTVAPSPPLVETPAVQPQAKAKQSDNQDRRWLALVGVLTLAASVAILFIGWKRNRS